MVFTEAPATTQTLVTKRHIPRRAVTAGSRR
jgi:hypothetical protein